MANPTAWIIFEFSLFLILYLQAFSSFSVYFPSVYHDKWCLDDLNFVDSNVVVAFFDAMFNVCVAVVSSVQSSLSSFAKVDCVFCSWEILVMVTMVVLMVTLVMRGILVKDLNSFDVVNVVSVALFHQSQFCVTKCANAFWSVATSILMWYVMKPMTNTLFLIWIYILVTATYSVPLFSSSLYCLCCCLVFRFYC